MAHSGGSATTGGGPLFKPFRALGYITEDVPFVVQRRGKETYMTVSVGRTWQVYNTAKLTLVMVGPQLPRAVCALACKKDVTFAAAGNAIHEARRMHPTGVYCAGQAGRVLQLLVLGGELLSLCSNRQLLVWTIGEHSKPRDRIELGPDFQPTCMLHPDTYLNKVLLGGADGSMQLWNVASCQLVHTFGGWGSPVRCLTGSPALDVVGVGLADGRVLLHNLRFDEVVLSLSDAAGAGAGAGRFARSKSALSAPARGGGSVGITCLSFSSGPGLPLLAAGGAAGIVALWNLEGRCLHALLRDAHDRALLSLHFFPGEPRLMSSAADNSVKQWVLDGADAVPRLLRFRSGHSAPPAVVRHYAEGLRLLSAGGDRAFRVFSTIQDQQSRELSQRHTAAQAKRLRITEEEIKLPRVTQLAACEVRERDWPNVVTCHAGDPAVYTWRLAHFAMGDHVLLPPPDLDGTPRSPSPATAVAVSCCGNFAIVGSSGGTVDRYNLQSGHHRGAYMRRAGADGSAMPAHAGAVVGVAADSCNRRLLSAGADAVLCLWDFRSQRLSAELPLGSPVTHVALHAGSGLAAIACADRVVRMVDIDACRVVRRFSGHSDRLTDVAISADCRWLLTSSMDSTLRVWDIPAAACLQTMHMGTPVTSMSLSATHDLLATAHVNKRGVFLWANQLLFGDVGTVSTYNQAPVPVHLPSIAAPVAASAEAEGSAGGAARRGADVRIAGGAAGSGSDGGDEDSGASEDGGASEDVLLDDAGRREVRMMLDGGVLSDSDADDSDSDDSSDFYEAGGSSSSSDSDDKGDAEGAAGVSRGKRRRAAQLAAAAAAAAAATVAQAEADALYKRTDASGAPQPLAPQMATLSSLPRSQWENLLHLDTIKARSKPLQPPKKPEAAPFFLPSVPGLSGQPSFTAAASDGAADGGAADGTAGIGSAGAGAGSSGGSRVLGTRRSGGGAAVVAAPSAFVALLRASGTAGDFASFVAQLRTLSPAAVDLELRSMVVLEGAVNDAAVNDIGLLLEALSAELAAGRNFELVQALLARMLEVHGDTVAVHANLAAAAEQLSRKLRPAWLRLDELLHGVRCMLDFVSGAQG